MHTPLANCKRFCQEDAMKVLCLCHYESARFAAPTRSSASDS